MIQETRSFVLKHVFKNVSKMKDNEHCNGFIEDHFGAPWCIGIWHKKDHLGVYLGCQRFENKKEWSIDTDFEIHILQPNGSSAYKMSDLSHCFTKAEGHSLKPMTWERMEREFLLNDELVVEVSVKITKITGIEDFQLSMFDTDDSFVLKHVFKNVSKMEDTEDCFGSMENHFGVPWCIGIKNNKQHLGVYLGCQSENNNKEWSIDTEFEIHVLHPSGNSSHRSSVISHCFTKDIGVGRSTFMTSERMGKEFLLNDELVVEIRVKITKITGIEGFHLNMNQKTRSFVLKYLFKNVSTMKDTERCLSVDEDHFGVPWSLGITHNQDHLGVHLYCNRFENKTEWSIDTNLEIHILHPNGKSAFKASSLSYCFKKTIGYGWKEFMTWEEMKKEYVVNDELVVAIRVKISKMMGIEVYLRRFDDEARSDVALVVNEKKLHVSKLLLASQSSYFKSMFLGKFKESGKTEIELKDINEYDLQKYLEMLYGEDALDDETVEGILHLADMYDTKPLIGRCEEYLSEVSRKTLKEKLEISMKFNLVELQKKCMSEIKTVDDVRSVIPERIYDMDPTILADLLRKTLDLSN